MLKIDTIGPITKIGINRPSHRNAIDGATATALVDAFTHFDKDPSQKVAVLYGVGSTFCAGADLHSVSMGSGSNLPRAPCPLGPTGMTLSKPVIAAVQGHAVAGGLELALWCDIRVIEDTTVFGVFCRRFGVPLIDGGTVRLPRVIGHGRAMDLILTGREVKAGEALHYGLASYLATNALEKAMEIAQSLCQVPQAAMRNDRLSAIHQWGKDIPVALREEFEKYGVRALESGEAVDGAKRFVQGQGRHGSKL